MALEDKKFYTNIDLLWNQLKGLRFQNISSDPTGQYAGQSYYNTTSKIVRLFDGTNWVDMGRVYSAGTGITISASNVISNAGVRSVTAGSSADKININTNGTSTTITINNVGNAGTVSGFTVARNVAANEDVTAYTASTGINISNHVIKNTGVISVVAGSTADKLVVNTNGTTATLTINNVAHATSADSATSATNATNAVNLKDSSYSYTATSLNTTLVALDRRITELEGRGRFLSGWDCTTGKPTTEPETTPYTYKSGDYFIVAVVGSSNNKKPNGSSYTGAASTTIETNAVSVNDTYLYDGTSWTLIHTPSVTVPQATNSIYGVVKGDTTLGYVSIDTSNPGRMVVNGWAGITMNGKSVALTGNVTGSTTVSSTGTISIATTLANNVVSTAKIVDDAVTNDKLSTNGEIYIQNGSASTTKATLTLGNTTTLDTLLNITGSTTGLVYKTTTNTYSVLSVSVIQGLLSKKNLTFTLDSGNVYTATIQGISGHEIIPIMICDADGEKIECCIQHSTIQMVGVSRYTISIIWTGGTAPTGWYAMCVDNLGS